MKDQIKSAIEYISFSHDQGEQVALSMLRDMKSESAFYARDANDYAIIMDPETMKFVAIVIDHEILIANDNTKIQSGYGHVTTYMDFWNLEAAYQCILICIGAENSVDDWQRSAA